MPDSPQPLDRDAFESLIRAHQAEIYRYVRYLGADSAAAEDVVQEVFLAALRGSTPPGMDAGLSGAWLRGIARNLFLQHCRRNRTSPVLADSSLLERAEAVWAGEFLRGDDGFDYVEALRKCLETLTDRQRRLLDQRYAQKKSRTEMARLGDMTENGVKSILRRIRASLGECIRERLNMERT